MDPTAHPLSIQELRTTLPSVIKKLDSGWSFTLIYRSRPVGRLLPLSHQKNRKDLLSALTKPKRSLLFKSKKSSVEWIRDER